MALCANTCKLYLDSRPNGCRTGGRGRRTGRANVVVKATASSEVAEYEAGPLERPKWAGETPLSRVVGAIISFKPIYTLLKIGARKVLISTAEKKDIPWREMTQEILESDVYKEFETVQNSSLVYPDYYLSPFHAYDEGNLSWLAAAEAEPATISMAMRSAPEVTSMDEANKILRGNWLKRIKQHLEQHFGVPAIRDIIDIGCSVGISTRYLAETFPSAKVTGLDLSPYFLSVAQFKDKQRPSMAHPIQWVHANGEETGFPSHSFDLVSISFVLHELPQRATFNMMKESFRLLRPGGTLAIIDQAPNSKILQELSPVLFTLLKSTEPFLDEYHLLNLEETIRKTGFVNVKSALSDARHRTLTATAPL
ncbi:hypothetical protein SAY86_027145 [Trapa natans]|uniref:Methyltransferase type 11 domain-containing protein n=1 Tax=Trapa natans TaxID=22666 RepID=A0AAN7QLS4_TRANT|nr:hypothetical protein SAY86_027145 [Trapa natans]